LAGNMLANDGKIPCRISGQSDPILFFSLGNVKTPVADGYFNVQKDIVILNNGKKIKHYYRDSLGIKYYTPIDKRIFKKPPSGWCSWYYYYQELDSREVLKNAEWMANNLKEYGAEYIQIDDAWQGTGHGLGENRDWTTVDKRFSDLGMDGLAREIKKLGMKPGLWLAPHGQSNKDLVLKHRKAFFLSKKDSSLSSTWEGDYLVKPSEEGLNFLENLFKTLKNDWGYSYFKIDGQPIVVNEYKRLLGEKKGLKGYRKTLRAIKKAIGDSTYLLGCWGIPLEGIGYMNGSRTGGDIIEGWNGFLIAFDAVVNWNFLHNIVWYSDPDVFLVREPQGKNIVRAWLTLQGLSGQALMASDRMYDLPESRVQMLKKVYPAVNIYPIDLYRAGQNKKIWDLKVNHLGRNYDIVAFFNFTDKRNGKYVSFKELGLDTTKAYHIYDFWNADYLGSWTDGIYVDILPQDVKVLTLIKEENYPILISTSRHITQGWVELKKLTVNENEIDGTSHIIKGEKYVLTFAFPAGEAYEVSNCNVTSETGGIVNVNVKNHQRWAEVIISTDKSGDYDWKVSFEKKNDYYVWPVIFPSWGSYKINKVEPLTFSQYKVHWPAIYYLSAGYIYYVNGKRLGWTPINEFVFSTDNLTSPITIEVRSAWYDRNESKKALKYVLNPSEYFANTFDLTSIKPDVDRSEYYSVRYNVSAEGNVLSIGGKTYEKGIGVHAYSVLKYKIGGLFSKFTASVGIDDETKGKGEVIFRVLGDGKELWSSGKMKANVEKNLNLDIKGIKELILEVSPAGDNAYDHADWINPILLR